MTKLALSLMLILLSGIASAQEIQAEQAGKELWVCYVSGKQSFGGPVGDIWQTVRGEGPTRIEALDEAQGRCFSMGLNSCMLRDCQKFQ